MPAQLQYKPNSPNRTTLSASTFTLQIALYQEFLMNRFLLDRLPGCGCGSTKSRQELVETARKMLDVILLLCANRDKLTNYTVCFVWTIAYSGIPSAAVLSVELLKQSQSSWEDQIQLPRSEVIQGLSMFIGCLQWIRPSEGNYALCVRTRKVIKRILDQVLEMPLSKTFEPKEPGPDPGPSSDGLAISSIFAPEDEPDYVEWLNSIDWTRDMLQDAWT